MPRGKAQRLHELRLAHRARQEMGRTRIVELAQSGGIAARHQRQQRAAMRTDGGRQRPHRREPIVQCPACIDDGHRRAARLEPAFRPIRPPRGDDAPARTGRQSRQFVALAKGQQEQRAVAASGGWCSVGHCGHS
jgi:hypothetical protein